MAGLSYDRCKVCRRRARRRGLCDRHYQRVRRHEQDQAGGDPQGEVLGAMVDHLRSLAAGLERVGDQIAAEGRRCRRVADLLDRGA